LDSIHSKLFESDVSLGRGPPSDREY
jgi:hypothetical protein